MSYEPGEPGIWVRHFKMFAVLCYVFSVHGGLMSQVLWPLQQYDQVRFTVFHLQSPVLPCYKLGLLLGWEGTSSPCGPSGPIARRLVQLGSSGKGSSSVSEWASGPPGLVSYATRVSYSYLRKMISREHAPEAFLLPVECPQTIKLSLFCAILLVLWFPLVDLGYSLF